MKKSISNWQIAGFVFTSLLGTFLHFLYDLTEQNKVAGLFSAVNESTWEHMKLMFFPMLLFAIFESFFVKKENYWCVKLIGILTGLLLIPVLFYTLNGAFGKTPDVVNILIFFLSAFAGYVLEARLLEKGIPACKRTVFAVVVLVVIAVMFWVFTVNPPQLPIFIPPDLR